MDNEGRGSTVSGPVLLLVYGCAGIACAVAGFTVLARPDRQRAEHWGLLVALFLTAVWCAVVASLGEQNPLAQTSEVMRNLAWLYAGYRMFANDGRHESLRQVRPLAGALVTVEGLQFILLGWSGQEGAFEVSALLRMLVSVGALVSLHNLFGGAADTSRRLLAWTCGGMAAFWAFELNFYTIAYLTGFWASDLGVARGVTIAGVAIAAALGASRRAPDLSFRPSRALTFSTLSLGIVGIYMLTMVTLANGVARLSGDLAYLTQTGFLLAATALSLLWLPSAKLRRTVRDFGLKHLFRHRYDYRSEWLRFTRTIANAPGLGLHERAVKSLADIADSPGGLLLTTSEDGSLSLASRWCWPTIDVPAEAVPRSLAALLERREIILDFNAVRDGEGDDELLAAIPAWLRADEKAWAAVPLLHGERLVGVVVLARPQLARRLDWEDHDLLAIAGQQVASYLAEHASQQALEDSARFDEFNRRMAFVMHDIKNLSSQFGLLARNAERHSENPAFRRDMLVTLRNSADKLDALVSRLGRYRSGRTERNETVDLYEIARETAQRFCALGPVNCQAQGSCIVGGNREALLQAAAHLVQNALDASGPDSPVTVAVRNSGVRGELSVIDAGSGMSAEFVRTGLFRPFISTKDNGFGIGACEAREMITAMGGRLDVESREGLGSRFTLSLPLSSAARLLERRGGDQNTTVQEEAA